MRPLPSLLLLAALAFAARTLAGPSPELIYVDDHGVMRWRGYQTEVAMLGANYCLPSASDFRAAAAARSESPRPALPLRTSSP